MKIKLKLLMPNGKTDLCEIDADSVSIGRDPDCNLSIDDSEKRCVSWMHARLESEDNRIILRDFHSKNGTFLNDERIEATAELRVGDVVRLGQSGPKLLVLDAAPSEPAAVVAGPVASTPEAVNLSASDKASGLADPLVRYALVAAAVVFVFLASLLWFVPDGRQSVADAENVDRAEEADKDPENNPTEEVPGKSGTPANKPSPESSANENGDEAKKPKTFLSPTEIEAQSREAVVWIGAELRGFKMPLCTAWAVRPDLVVTTAREAKQLAEYHAQGHPVFAFQDSGEKRFISVTSFRFPENKQADTSSDAAGWGRSVAVMKLAEPLPATCRPLRLAKIAEQVQGMRLVSLGYAISYDSPKAYDAVNQPKWLRVEGKVVGTKPVPNADDDLPLLEADLQDEDGMDGAPVFGRSGEVIGVRMSAGQQWYVVPADHVLELLGR